MGLGYDDIPKLTPEQIRELVYNIQKHAQTLEEVLHPSKKSKEKDEKIPLSDDNF